VAKRSREAKSRDAPSAAPVSAPASARWWLPVVFAVALALRVAYLLSVRDAYFFGHLLTEAGRYHRWAGAILDGLAPARPPFDEAPAYPYAVAALFAIFGRSVTPVAAVQAMLDAASCVGLGLLGRRLGGERAGWITGGLAAAYGPLIYFSAELLPATLQIFTVTAALVATPSATDAENGKRWLVAGGTWAAALLVRSEVALALPVIWLHAWVLAGWRTALRAAAAPVALVALSLGVNVASSGHWVPLTTGSGVNLWLGNNPSADGVSPFIHGELQQVADAVGERAKNPAEADALFRAQAVDWMAAHPGAVVRLAWRKLAWTWTDRELPNTSDIDWETSHSWLFRLPVFPLHFGLILPLAMAGALALGAAWRRQLWLLAPVAMALGTSVLFFTNARFRLPLCLAALPLAGLALQRLWIWIRRAQEHRRGLIQLAAGAGAGVVVAWANVEGVRTYRIPEIDANTGGLERAAGHFVEAARYLQLAVEGNPDDAGAWVELALALEQSGRVQEAQATWNKALARMPANPLLRRMASNFLRRNARGVARP
jgi:hypothetical protein